MTRPIPQQALDLCHEFEQGPGGGFAATPYNDPSGFLTIGWGHLIGPTESFPNPMTADEADALLRLDLADHALGWEATASLLTDGQYAALLDFSFNEGVGALLGSTLFRDVQANKLESVPFELMRWCYARDATTGQMVQMPGLLRRRQWEAAVFSTGALPKSG